MAIEKFCTKCGKKFVATGREVICPACKQAAQEDAKRTAVLKAKRASWTGESVPVRISGRASTVIREWAKLHNMKFAESLDDLLQRAVAGDMEISEMLATRSWVVWEDITPYKSRRRDTTAQDVQEVKTATGKPQNAPQTAQAAKATSKATSKAAGKATSKAVRGGRKE